MSGSEHPGVFGAAALGRVDDKGAFAQSHACQAAKDYRDLASGQNERPQVDMSRSEAGLHKGRGSREGESGLSDVALRVCFDPCTEILDLRACRGRSDQHSVAASAVNFFHDEVRKV